MNSEYQTPPPIQTLIDNQCAKYEHFRSKMKGESTLWTLRQILALFDVDLWLYVSKYKSHCDISFM